MEEFMYVFSHDFSTPLRHIREFTHLLLKKADDKLDADEKKYADILVNSVASAEKMIEGLLKLSRLNTRCEDFQDIDCNALVIDLEKTLNKKNIKLIFKNLPAIKGEKSQITELFSQLIQNAINFQNPNLDHLITIKHSEDGNYHKFSIIDNGIGIPLSFARDAFTVFRKNHPDGSNLEGIGIGLTLCKSIVEKHQGRIWVESSSDEGTTISFTIKT